MSAALSAYCWPFQVNNMPMVVLIHPVFDCLMRLGKPDALVNEEEVRKNVLFFYFWLILLSLSNMLKWCMKASLLWSWPMLPPSCRWTVWCCSCIASGSSWRRPAASGWTSCSSYCGTASCCRRASPPWPACCCWRSWNSEQEAGCWAARRTSTTTVKLQTRIVARTQVLDGRFADIRAPLVPPTLITKPATSSRKSSAHFFFPRRVQLINCKT